jgi:hypothetical protein
MSAAAAAVVLFSLLDMVRVTDLLAMPDGYGDEVGGAFRHTGHR